MALWVTRHKYSVSVISVGFNEQSLPRHVNPPPPCRPLPPPLPTHPTLCPTSILLLVTHWYQNLLKPIFHCDAKTFELGTFASPNAKYTNMLVALALGEAKSSRHLTQNPQRESVEYRLCWVPNVIFLHWPCTFHFLCRFHLRWVANANPISSGIWALLT